MIYQGAGRPHLHVPGPGDRRGRKSRAAARHGQRAPGHHHGQSRAPPTVPNTTPPNFGIPRADRSALDQPAVHQAQQGVPNAPPASNPSEFKTVLEPFQAQSFATGFVQSDGILGPMALAEAADGTFFISGGAVRNELFHVAKFGGAIGAPLATLPYQIFALAFDMPATCGRPPAAARCSRSTRPPARSSTSSATAITLRPGRRPQDGQTSTSRPAAASKSSTRRPIPSRSTAATRTCGSRAWPSTTRATCGR